MSDFNWEAAADTTPALIRLAELNIDAETEKLPSSTARQLWGRKAFAKKRLLERFCLMVERRETNWDLLMYFARQIAPALDRSDAAKFLEASIDRRPKFRPPALENEMQDFELALEVHDFISNAQSQRSGVRDNCRTVQRF
jgi:hypothetical protein